MTLCTYGDWNKHQINNEEVYAWRWSPYFNPIQLNDIAVDPNDPNLVVGDYYRVHKKYKAIAIIDSCTYNAVECGLERSNLNSKDANFIGTKKVTSPSSPLGGDNQAWGGGGVRSPFHNSNSENGIQKNIR